MNDFDGLVAVVTGGSTGIGRAVVRRIAAAGGRVAYCSYDEPSLDEAREELAEFDDRVRGIRADVRRLADLEGLVAAAAALYGGIDALVCCAGIQTYGTVEDTSVEDWHAVLDTNLTGCFLAAKAAVPHLRARGGGAIVNVSSVQGLTPAQRVVGYAVSKAGVDGLTRALAVDHAADRIRANSVAPGPVDTPLLLTKDPVAAEASTPAPPRPAAGPLPRIARPAEIAEVVAFLAGPASSYVTGATFAADGGMLATPGRVILT